MANKFIDPNGLLYFWQKILSKFVAKEVGKGLSTNDYTTDEKTKLGGIEAGANKTTIDDSLTSTAADHALSANQGKLLNDAIAKITTDIGDLGGGDMMKALYDKDNNGQVDKADDADKLGGNAPDYFAAATHTHDKATSEKDGLLSKEDFSKLAGIADGANNYTLPKATDSVLGGIKVGENLSVSEDGTLSADAQHIDVDDAIDADSVNPVQNKVVKAALDGKSDSNHVHAVATADADGFMSKGDFSKLAGVESGANKYTHPAAHPATMITEDETHRFSTDAEKTAWNGKVDSEDGKGLSTNDYTTAEKNKLNGIAEGANKTVVDETLSADSTNPVQNKAVQTALNGKVNTSVLGQANGVATLDESGLIPSAQLPSYVDDVIEGYADVTVDTTTDESGFKTTTVTVNGFYSDEAHQYAITGESGKIYVDVKTNLSYRWGGTVYVQITSSDCTAITNAEIDDIIAKTL